MRLHSSQSHPGGRRYREQDQCDQELSWRFRHALLLPSTTGGERMLLPPCPAGGTELKQTTIEGPRLNAPNRSICPYSTHVNVEVVWITHGRADVPRASSSA